MNPQQAALLCLLLALLLSNLPFLGNRWLAWLSPAAPMRSTSIRIVLWLLLYALWSAITIALEGSFGKLQPEDWSVWAISAVFFAVLGFPGVTYRYLWRSKKKT